MFSSSKWCAFAAPLALLAMACSEPVPPASQGAFTLSFVQTSSTPGAQCRVKGHQAQVGGATAKSVTDLKKDTIGGAVIFCSVTTAGAGFEADGAIDLEGRHLEFVAKGITAAATKDNPFVGTVSYSSLETAGPYQSPECKFWLQPYTENGNTSVREEIAGGRIWVDFACPSINNASANSVCGISTGTIAMQNCLQ